MEDPGVRIEVIGPERAHVLTAVHRSAFGSPQFTDAVATVTVCSAGAGEPGLLEPMGVRSDHRGEGYGRAISIAAGASLQQLGASSVMVGAPSSNVGAVATYASAGFETLPERQDRSRTIAWSV